ncbi:hypothetical protein HYE34_02085 [Mycoplasmopsis bovis]|nr:hypothetical protein HYE34_02085 [Mycoplasmopsis bovis]
MKTIDDLTKNKAKVQMVYQHLFSKVQLYDAVIKISAKVHVKWWIGKN